MNGLNEQERHTCLYYVTELRKVIENMRRECGPGVWLVVWKQVKAIFDN